MIRLGRPLATLLGIAAALTPLLGVATAEATTLRAGEALERDRLLGGGGRDKLNGGGGRGRCRGGGGKDRLRSCP